MSLTYRRLIFLFFVLLFIIIVPIVYLYATGQTVNWNRKELEKNSNLIIESRPSQAKITLDKEPLISKLGNRMLGGTAYLTKAKITNLKPGEYNALLEKEGYRDWQGRFTIYPGQALVIGPVQLFKDTSPKLLYEISNEGKLSSSPDNTQLALEKDSSVIIMDPNQPDKAKTYSLERQIEINEEEVAEERIKESSSELQWSIGQKFILKDLMVVDLVQQKVIDLSSILDAKASRLLWDDKNDHWLYYLTNQGVYRYDLINKQISLIHLANGQKINDYLPKNERLYLLIGETAADRRVMMKQLNNGEREFEMPLPIDGQPRFENLNNEEIIIFEERNKKFYYLEEPIRLIFRFRVSEGPSQVVIHSRQGNKLWYATPLEIRKWEDGNDSLISRLGEPVLALSGLSVSDYLVVATSKEIVLQPIYNDPLLPYLNLVKADNLQNILVQSNGLIYFYGTYQEKSGIFSLEIL